MPNPEAAAKSRRETTQVLVRLLPKTVAAIRSHIDGVQTTNGDTLVEGILWTDLYDMLILVGRDLDTELALAIDQKVSEQEGVQPTLVEDPLKRLAYLLPTLVKE